MTAAAQGAPVSPVVVGREPERAAITAVLTAAAGGESGLVLLSGEAGVGKTRLIEEASRAGAADGMRVLAGHCVQLGSEGLPFAPLVEALRELTRSTTPEELAAILGPARRLMPRFVPAAGELPERAAEQGSQLLDSVLGLIEHLAATQPLVVVLEDLHWADRSTLDLAAYLVQALRGLPVALLFTYRSDELHRRHPLRPLVLAWERMRWVRHLELSRFDRGEVRALVHAILRTEPDDAVVETVYARSDGNAFLVEELVGLVRAGEDPAGLPPSLRDLLLARVDALGDDARRVVRYASVAGPEVDETLLLAAAGGPTDPALAALREAVEAHLLTVAGAGYRFRHALARDAVYDDMLPGERSRIHAAYGAAIEAEPGLIPDPTARAAASAYHWFAALDLPRALSASIAAARLSASGLAPTEGLSHFERALQLWPRVPDAEARSGADRPAVLMEAADAAHLSGAVDRALVLLALALEELPPADGIRRAGVLERQARVLRDLGRLGEAVRAAEAGLALLPADHPSDLRAATLATLANLHIRGSAAEPARQVGHAALLAAREIGAAATEAEAGLTVGIADTWLGDFDRALDELAVATALAQRAGAMVTALRGAINLSHVLETLGRSSESAVVAEEGMAVAERSGLMRTLGAYLAGNLAESLLHLGDWPRAEEVIGRVLRTRPEGVYAATLLDVAGQLAALTGRPGEAAARIAEAAAMVGELDDEQFAQPLAATAAMLAAGDGDLDAAIDGLLRAVSSEPAASPYSWPVLWLAARFDADRATPAPDERIATLAAGIGSTTAPQRAFAALTATELRRAAGTATPDEWRDVAARWGDLAWPYLQAYASYRLAEALCRTGDRDAAATALQDATAVADRLGAAPLLEDIAALDGREHLSRPVALPSAALARRLTARELEVLRLLAAGRSNPQIAATLFISPKTASVHVSNILAKLEVGGRLEAAAVARRSGLLPDD